MTYCMTPKVKLTFYLDLNLRVKHLTCKVTTDVQGTLLLNIVIRFMTDLLRKYRGQL